MSGLDATTRLAINQATVPSASTLTLIDEAARAQYSAVGLWRDRLSECGIRAATARARAAGLDISSLCRAGWFCIDGPGGGRKARFDDNRRAVDEAAELGAQALVVVCGPAPTHDLEAGRAEIAEAIGELSDYASQLDVRLAIEPMHPIYCGDRSAIVTLDQALQFGLDVIVDAYHVWWDPRLEQSLAASADRILGFHLSDWISPLPDHLNGRGMIGDGCIDFARLLSLVDGAGYRGPIEIEIFNSDVWQLEPAQALALIAQRFRDHVTR